MAETLPPIIGIFEASAEDFFETVDQIEERLDRLAGSQTDPNVGLNDADFEARYDAVETSVADLDALHADPSVGLSESEFEEKEADVAASVEALDALHADPSVGLNIEDLEAKGAEVEGLVAALNAEQVTLDTLPASAAVDELTGSLADADIAATDLMGSLAALGPVADGTAAEIDDLAGSADNAAVSLQAMAASADEAASAAALGDLSEVAEGIGPDLETVGAGADVAAEGLDGLSETANDVDRSLFGLYGEFVNVELGIHSLDDALDILEQSFASFLAGEIDAETALQNIEATGIDVEQMLEDVGLGVQDFGLAFADAEGAVEDLEQGLLDLEGAVLDGEGAMQALEGALNDATQAGGSFIGFLNSIAGALGGAGEGGIKALGSISPMIVLIGTAIVTALPLVEAFAGELGALAAIGFTAFAGIGAFALGAIGDLGSLETAAKTALKAYQDALQPFVQPIVNNITPIITDALFDMIPVAKAASGAIGGLVDELDSDMSGSGFKTFIEWITANTGPAISVIGNFAGSVVDALAEMGEQGQPFIDMIERGISSFGDDLAKFGQSNEFKDFVDWLVQNGPAIGGDLEGIGKAFGHIFSALTPVGMDLLSDFTSAVRGISDVVGPLVSFFSGSGDITATAAAIAKMTSATQDASTSLPDLDNKLADLKSQMDAVKASFDDGKISFAEFAAAEATLNQSYESTATAQKNYTDNLESLTTKLGTSDDAVEAMAKSLNIDLYSALSPDQLREFTENLNDTTTAAQQTAQAMESAGVAADDVNKVLSAGTSAAKAAQTSWASYGDAITHFSSSVIPPTSAAIAQFYTESELQGATFSQNIQKAIRDGYDPTLVSQIIQAGPAQASQLLQGMVNAQGTGLANLVNGALGAITKEGQEAVEQARVTAEAVAAKSSTMASQLSEALALDQALTVESAAQAVSTVAGQYSGGLAGLLKVAQEYGIALPNSITAQTTPASDAAVAQAQAIVHGIEGQAPAAAGAGNALGAAISAGIGAGISGGLAHIESTVSSALASLVATAQADVSAGVPQKKVAKLAEGGLVTSPMLAIIGEAGPEMVLPASQIPGGFDGGSVSPLPLIGTAPAGQGAGNTTVGVSVAVTGGLNDIDSLMTQITAQVRNELAKKARAYGVGGSLGKYAGTRGG